MTVAAVEHGVRVVRVAVGSEVADWRRVVQDADGSHLAHSPEWAGVVRRAYGHDPWCFLARDDEGRAAVLPAVVVRRPWLGTVVASMPFLDGGGPSGASPALARALVETLVQEARRAGARSVELRCACRLEIGVQPLEHKVNLALPLPADPWQVWRQLDGGVRNQIRKAERAGLRTETGGAEHLDAFYAVYAARMRDLGSPPHARAFFAAILEGFGPRAHVVLVRQGATVVGGLLALAFKNALVVPWASCRKECFALCPNMLLYWDTIRAACLAGFRRFDFGRSTRGSGTYRFKRQWGAHEEPLRWYSIPTGRHAGALRPDAGRTAATLAGLWRRLPPVVSRHLGPRIRPYLTQ